MPRLPLLLLTLAVLVGGGANLYLGGLEATRVVETQIDQRLSHASNAVQLLLREEAQRAEEAANQVIEATSRRRARVVEVEGTVGEEELRARESAQAQSEGEASGTNEAPLVQDEASVKRLASIVGADVTVIRDGEVEASTLVVADRNRLAAAAGAATHHVFGLGDLPQAEFSLYSIPLPLFAPKVPATMARRLELGGEEPVQVIVSAQSAAALLPVVEGQKQSLLFTGVIGLFGLVLLLFRGKAGAAGVGPIADVAERAADGDVTAHAAEYLPGELGRLARAVNRLAAKGRQANASQGLADQLTGTAKPQASADELADSFPFGGPSSGTSAPHGFGTPGPAQAQEFGSTPGPFSPGPAGPTSVGPEADQGEVDPFDIARSQTPPPPPSNSPWDQVPSDPVPPPSGQSWDQPTRPLAPGAPGYSGNIEGKDWTKSDGPQPSDPPVPPADAYGQAIAEAMGASKDNPDATVVAAIPEALLRATSRAGDPAAPQAGAAPAPGQEAAPSSEGRQQSPPEAQPAAAEEDPDEAAFRKVYEDFLRIRAECGEPTAGISYEKFAKKLRTNKAQLMEKYQARTVRFTAYVKEGKAALKASPIRD